MRFNAHEHKQTDNSREPFEGTFRARIDKAESGFTRANDECIDVEWSVMGPTRIGRRLWQKLVMSHANPKVVEISIGKLTEISLAVGRPTWEYEGELVGGVCDVVVKIKDDRSEIVRCVVPKVDGQAQHAPLPVPMRPEPPAFATDQDCPF